MRSERACQTQQGFAPRDGAEEARHRAEAGSGEQISRTCCFGACRQACMCTLLKDALQCSSPLIECKQAISRHICCMQASDALHAQAAPKPQQPSSRDMTLQWLGHHGFLQEGDEVYYDTPAGCRRSGIVSLTGGKWLLLLPGSNQRAELLFSWAMAVGVKFGENAHLCKVALRELAGSAGEGSGCGQGSSLCKSQLRMFLTLQAGLIKRHL